ncbi:MAG TPA: FixH family protein [Bacteroidia bacterium]|nr:FixH family protein [Bacteroidia bacterium]
MKFNWGWGIFIFLVLFMSFILQLVYRCTQQRVDLVSEKYYENEIKFQQRIDMETNTSFLDGSVRIETGNGKMEINYPEVNKVKNGQITFFKPDDARQDFTVPIQVSPTGQQVVDISELTKGRWNIQFQWSQDGKPYYSEHKVLID